MRQIPRNVPALPLPHPVLVFLAALLGWHDAGVANEWEQKLPEKDERRYRELEAKRSKEIAQGGKLPPWEEEEFQALEKKKYPYGRGGASKGPQQEGPESLPADDALLTAGQLPDKGDLTTAGRALQKHGGREGSAFPKATGSPDAVNKQGERVLREIVTDPDATKIVRHHARFGEILEVKLPDGRGARFSADGKKFIGFIEP